MISHFHYDPVWWNTQAAYTSVWSEDPPGRCRQTNGFESGARASRDGPPRAGVQVRAGRGRLPQAVLGHPPRGPRRPAPVHRRRPRRGDGRRLQRAQHQPDQPRDDDPKLRARHGFSARHPRRRPAHRVATGCLRPRPAISGDGRRCRADVQLVGPRPAPPVGSDAGPGRPPAHAVLQRVRVDRAVGTRAADPLHACALLGGVVDGLVGDAGRGRAGDLRVVRDAEDGRADPQCAAAGRHRLHAAEQVGHRHPPRLERALHLAAVRVRAASRVLRRRTRRTRCPWGRGRRRRPGT